MGLRRREPLPHIDAPTFSGSARTVLYTERNSLLQPATSTEDSTIPAINATYFSVLKLCSRTELKDWKRCAHIPLRWRQQMNTPLYWHQNKSRNAGALSVTRKRPSVYASTKNNQSPITLISFQISLSNWVIQFIQHTAKKNPCDTNWDYQRFKYAITLTFCCGFCCYTQVFHWKTAYWNLLFTVS